MLAGLDALVIKIGRLKCPRDEWNGTHLVVMVYKPPIENMEQLSRFDDLLEAVNCHHDRMKISGALLPYALMAAAEYDELLATFFVPGAS
jgi:hypothetical protein